MQPDADLRGSDCGSMRLSGDGVSFAQDVVYTRVAGWALLRRPACLRGFSRPVRPHGDLGPLTQGIGLRPQPWAIFSRPVGPVKQEALREPRAVGPEGICATLWLMSATLIPKDQLWFHHPEMQARIRRAEEDFASGRATRTETPAEPRPFWTA